MKQSIVYTIITFSTNLYYLIQILLSEPRSPNCCNNQIMTTIMTTIRMIFFICASMGNDGGGRDAEILVAMAGGNAC